MRRMNIIRSRGHQPFTEEIDKVALSAEDDKRVILPDCVHSPGAKGLNREMSV